MNSNYYYLISFKSENSSHNQRGIPGLSDDKTDYIIHLFWLMLKMNTTINN